MPAGRTPPQFSPATWTDDYVHPEGIRTFYTKFWQGVRFNAVGQRHYLRIGGCVEDVRKGTLSTTDPYSGFRVLLHEMGHCFFLDDLYDKAKYPDTLVEEGVAPLQPKDSTMYAAGGAGTLQPMDHAMLRRTWDAQRDDPRFVA